MPLIMGRKTFESMNGPLPGRINIVVTSRDDYKPEGALIAHDIHHALDMAKDADTREIFIIGGGHIFEQTLNLVQRVYLTRVHATIDGDTHYPVLDPANWTKISEEDHPSDSRHNYAFTFEVWERK